MSSNFIESLGLSSRIGKTSFGVSGIVAHSKDGTVLDSSISAQVRVDTGLGTTSLLTTPDDHPTVRKVQSWMCD